MRSRLKPWAVALSGALVLGVAAQAAARPLASSARVFYLTLKRGECGMRTGSPKTVALVPCSNSAHTFEVYAIRHGGWGHGTEPSLSVLKSQMRLICLTAYTQLTGRSLAAPYGYQWFAPDPGKEEAQYGDKLICNLTHWPQTASPLGTGWHVHH